MPEEDAILKALIEQFHGSPEGYTSKLGEWMSSLRDLLSESGIDPEGVNRGMASLLEQQGEGPLSTAPDAVSENLLAKVAELLHVPEEAAAEIPGGGLFELESILGEVEKLQKENVAEIQQNFEKLGVEPSPHMNALMAELAGEEPPGGEIPPPEMEALPPEIDAQMPKITAELEGLEKKWKEKEDAGLPLEAYLEDVEAEKDKLKAYLAPHLAVLGIPPAAFIGVLFAETPADESKSMEEMKKEMDVFLPEGDDLPEGDFDLPETDEPAVEQSPDDLLKELENMENQLKGDLAKNLETLGMDASNILGMLFAPTPEAGAAAQAAFQEKMDADTPKPPPLPDAPGTGPASTP